MEKFGTNLEQIFRKLCTFRLVRIFTLEEMFASGKEMGKGCVAVHTIGDFLFWMKNTTGLLSAQNFRRKRILFVRTRSSSLNWTIFFWGKSFHKRLCRRKIFKITERYAHLIICAILRKLGFVGRNVQFSYLPLDQLPSSVSHFLSMTLPNIIGSWSQWKDTWAW